MNLLREYIRELLTEAAKKPRDLPAGVHIVIDPQGNRGAAIHYADEDGDGIVATQDGPWGEIYIVDVAGHYIDSPCGSAWKVSSANTGSGWGPMLYDVAMEYATVMGGGLIADRDAVSPDARGVWAYYFNRRGDVKAHQLDNVNNELTPEIEEDNCDQKVAGFDVSRYGDRYSQRSKKFVNWTKSPLSKRYTKEPTTLNALRAGGRVIER